METKKRRAQKTVCELLPIFTTMLFSRTDCSFHFVPLFMLHCFELLRSFFAEQRESRASLKVSPQLLNLLSFSIELNQAELR